MSDSGTEWPGETSLCGAAPAAADCDVADSELPDSTALLRFTPLILASSAPAADAAAAAEAAELPVRSIYQIDVII